MADDSEKKDSSEKSLWNSAFDYFAVMGAIEKAMIEAKINKDFIMLNELLDDYWIMLSEWFTPKEEELHQQLRKEQKEAYKIICDATKAGKNTIATETIEVYINRWRAMLKTYHDHNMRSPRGDDVEDNGLMARRAKMNPGRQWQ